MRKLGVQTFLTLDGVMQAPGGPEEDPSGGFKHGGWSVNYWDDRMGQIMDESMSKPYEMLLGRKTYEIFAAHWPHIADDDPIAAKFNRIDKYVASRTLKRLDWKRSTLLSDVPGDIRKLKAAAGGELQVHGSGDLIRTLLRDNLVDAWRIWIFPVLLGSGRRLFVEGTTPTGLKLVETRTSSTGVVLQVLETAGKPEYGTFDLEHPPVEEIAKRRKASAGV
jgi:dihydrofolate reductase